MEVDKVDIARHHGVEDFPTLVFYKSEIPAVYEGKVEIFLEQREVAFLSPSKICENLNFSTEIQIFANFAG